MFDSRFIPTHLIENIPVRLVVGETENEDGEATKFHHYETEDLDVFEEADVKEMSAPRALRQIGALVKGGGLNVETAVCGYEARGLLVVDRGRWIELLGV